MSATAVAVGLWLALGAELYARFLYWDAGPDSPWRHVTPFPRYVTAMAIIPFAPVLCAVFCAAYWIERIRYGP